MANQTAAFLRHNGEFNPRFDEGKFARRLGGKSNVFCVIRETPAFYFIESNEQGPSGKFLELQVSKKTMKLAGRDAKRGGSFEVVEF